MHVPKGLGIFGGLMGIYLAAVVTAFAEDDNGGSEHKVLLYALLIVPFIAGIAWNKCGAGLLMGLAKGDKNLSHKLADTVETVFFITVIVTIAVLYNMGLFNF